MQTKLTEILRAHSIESDTIDAILADFPDDYILKTEALDNIALERQQILLDSKVNLLLTQANAKNITACKALIDFSIITFNGDEIVGLNEQIDSIKAQNPFMFDSSNEYAPKGNSNTLTNYDDLSDDEYFNFLKYKGE